MGAGTVHMSVVIPALRRWRYKDQEFKVILNHTGEKKKGTWAANTA